MTKPAGYEEILLSELCELRDCRDYYVTCLDGLIPSAETQEGSEALKQEKKHNVRSTTILTKCLVGLAGEACITPDARLATIRSGFETPNIQKLEGSEKDAELLAAAMKVSDNLFSMLLLAWTIAKHLEASVVADDLRDLVSHELIARDQMKESWHKVEALGSPT